jgi:SAM-dependent methyltransferase
MGAYPALAGYSRADVHAGLMGQGGLFLAHDMANRLSLRSGMRVLDLACGAGATSLYLARNYGVVVYAVDRELPNGLLDRASAAGFGDLVIPLRADARQLPFAPGFFDAVFTMNSLCYFGTDDLFPAYLASFLKPGGELVVGCPCYREELSSDSPKEFLIEFPACLAVHSPGWWQMHFEKSRAYAKVVADLHPRGVEFWEDRVRYLIEEQEPKDMPIWRQQMVRDMIALLDRDLDGFVSHFVLHAKRNGT